jgi:hypothetical protein
VIEKQSPAAGRARVDYESSPNEFAKWNSLGIIGNSTIGKAAIIVPVVGYLLLFNHEVVSFLRLHSEFCKDCTVSWRLNFFYFGSFFVAIGSLAFGFACPPMIARHAGAHDFYEAEKDYYDTEEHRRFLVGHILAARATTYIQPKYMYTPTSEEEMMTKGTLPELMGEHYFLQNRSRRKTRLIILGSYGIGAALLAVPTIGTCFQIMKQLLQG